LNSEGKKYNLQLINNGFHWFLQGNGVYFFFEIKKQTKSPQKGGKSFNEVVEAAYSAAIAS